MNRVFVDTSTWLALLNTDDQFHQQAQIVKATLKQQKYRLITTDFVLLEVADAFASPPLRPKAINFITRSRNSQSLRVIPISQSLFQEGLQLYNQRIDKTWGLTDCISFVIMHQERISVAFSSDRHFEQAGFARLMQPKRSGFFPQP